MTRQVKHAPTPSLYPIVAGTLPSQSWALGLQAMMRLYLSENLLTGHLPREWFSTNSFPKAVFIDIRWNRFQGPVPQLSIYNISLPTTNWSLTLVAVPMSKGYGLCGNSPDPGPKIVEFQSQQYMTGEGHVTTLPSCPAGTAFP